MAADESEIELWEGWGNHYSQHWEDELAARRGSASAPILPELRGARVRLRDLESGDVTQLHFWANDAREKLLWRDDPGVVGFDVFRERLNAAVATGEPHLIVEGLHSGRMIGWVYADMLSRTHQRCHMHIYVIPEARSYGAGAEAGILFLDYLFGWLGMRKVVIELLLAQDNARRMAQHWGFEIEGLFREERWLGMRRHDVVRLAMRRRAWQERLIASPGQAAPASHAPDAPDAPQARRLLWMGEAFLSDGGKPQRL